MNLGRALTIAAVGGFAAAFWWWGSVRYTQGYQDREIEVQRALRAAEQAERRVAQLSREAAAAILAAEAERDRGVQDALAQLTEAERHMCVSDDALRLLRDIR